MFESLVSDTSMFQAAGYKVEWFSSNKLVFGIFYLHVFFIVQDKTHVSNIPFKNGTGFLNFFSNLKIIWMKIFMSGLLVGIFEYVNFRCYEVRYW
jgi:hypothetical protein